MRHGWTSLERQLGALDRSLRRELGGRPLKPFQLAALIGGMAWESHTIGSKRYFDPTRLQQAPGGGGFGLAQWGGTRLTNPGSRTVGLEQFALGPGPHSIGDLLAHPHLFDEELKFAVHELSTDYRSAFEALVRTKTLGGVHGAEAIVEQKYEQNYDSYQVGANAPHSASYWDRIQLAQFVLGHFGR
jgi:hypothetical protein